MCWLKPLGFAVASVFLAIVVAFSWWHVNLLGVGLHSYGFTSGVKQSLVTFYAFESIFILIGLGMLIGEYIKKQSAGAAKSMGPSVKEQAVS